MQMSLAVATTTAAILFPASSPSALAQTVGNPVLAAGYLTDSTGAPVVGMQVAAYAWYPLTDADVGLDENASQLGTATTNSVGYYEIRVPYWVPSEYADGSGVTNVDLLADGQPSPFTVTAVAYSSATGTFTDADGTPISTSSSYQSDANAAMTSSATTTSLAAATVVPDSGWTGGCQPVRHVIDSTARDDRVGEIHVGWDLNATAYYESGSMASVEIGLGGSLSTLQASGTFAHANTSTATGDTPTPAHGASRYDTYYTAKFRHYHVKHWYTNCVLTKVWYTDEVGAWLGGPNLGPQHYFAQKDCSYQDMSYIEYMSPGAGRSKETGSTYTLGGAVGGLAGFSLKVKSENRTVHRISYRAGTRFSRYDICSANWQKGYAEGGLIYSDT